MIGFGCKDTHFPKKFSIFAWLFMTKLIKKLTLRSNFGELTQNARKIKARRGKMA